MIESTVIHESLESDLPAGTSPGSDDISGKDAVNKAEPPQGPEPSQILLRKQKRSTMLTMSLIMEMYSNLKALSHQMKWRPVYLLER
jgi:hypothetical protein